MTTDAKSPTRMSKKNLLAKLMQLGYTEEQLQDANGKELKRPDLLEKLNAHQQGEEGLATLGAIKDDVDDDDDVGVPIAKCTPLVDNDEFEQEPDVLDPPNPNDPGWTQYVLGQFQDDEVDGPHPRVEGLRRVACQLVGELIEEGCDLVSAPAEENKFRACTKAWGVFITKEGITKRFEALADANSENCFEGYTTYLVSMADTRAKGRMFRNALCLRKVVSAEEVNKTLSTSADIKQGGSVHASQISLIRLLADRQGLDISKVLDTLGIEYKLNDNTGDVNLNSLSYEDAIAVAIKMREMKEEQAKENG